MTCAVVVATARLGKGAGDLLAPPVDYNWIWSDWGSGGTFDVSF